MNQLKSFGCFVFSCTGGILLRFIAKSTCICIVCLWQRL